jgi:hypothetical protein
MMPKLVGVRPLAIISAKSHKTDPNLVLVELCADCYYKQEHHIEIKLERIEVVVSKSDSVTSGAVGVDMIQSTMVKLFDGALKDMLNVEVGYDTSIINSLNH